MSRARAEGGTTPLRVVGVIGAGVCGPEDEARAEEVGRRLAEAGCAVATGGLGGVMAAASRGAKSAGGLVIGILPGATAADRNPWVDVPIVTAMGDARNAILANSAEAFIAIAGGFGTLSEIAFALKRGKRVVSLGSWRPDPAVIAAETAAQAVLLVLAG
ncbi:MAG: TIGR00725 family protein [Planctomycetes bacterium]|nr:TIGR00725 family protein [Planctomycetota bacterium]